MPCLIALRGVACLPCLIAPYQAAEFYQKAGQHQRALKLYLKVPEREFFIDNLMVRIHSIIVMILEDRPCPMGVSIPCPR